jgi:hypothetical protein
VGDRVELRPGFRLAQKLDLQYRSTKKSAARRFFARAFAAAGPSNLGLLEIVRYEIFFVVPLKTVLPQAVADF